MEVLSPPDPWIETPCLKSLALSRIAGCNIYLKLENLQPSGSFKSRGIGYLMKKAIQSAGPDQPVNFYCSSGGNAGLACATAALSFHKQAIIVVPHSTKASMIEKLEKLGAQVVQEGAHWFEADDYLRRELLSKDSYGVYVPPFDHADVWHGNSLLVDELELQMKSKGGYDAIVCSVGGGGLLVGIMDGLERHGRLSKGSANGVNGSCNGINGNSNGINGNSNGVNGNSNGINGNSNGINGNSNGINGNSNGVKSSSTGVKVFATETAGADSLAYSLKSQKLSRLDAITSIATSLGCAKVAERAFEWAQNPAVVTRVFSDAEAIWGAACFADDERILVEPACGVSIVTAYNGTLSDVLFPSHSTAEFAELNIVLIVCGGSNTGISLLTEYQKNYPFRPEEKYEIQ